MVAIVEAINKKNVNNLYKDSEKTIDHVCVTTQSSSGVSRKVWIAA